MTNLRICNLCNFKSFFSEFDKCYYELYDSSMNQQTYIQLLLNKSSHPWNDYFSKKIEKFASQSTVIRSVAVARTSITREITQLCLQES